MPRGDANLPKMLMYEGFQQLYFNTLEIRASARIFLDRFCLGVSSERDVQASSRYAIETRLAMVTEA